mgnify:CR=1 FL=1
MALAAGLIILHSVIQQHEITADHLVQQVEAIHPEALVLLSMPSHHASKEWIQIGMPCCGEKDTAFQRECCTRCVQSGVMMEKFEESTLSLFLPLQSYPSVVLVPSRQSLQEHYEMGMILEQTARYLDRKVVVVARIGFPAGEKPGHPQQGSAEFHWERTLMKCVTSGASGELFDLEASAASPEQAAVLRMMAMMRRQIGRASCRERV